jgi:hypothetical protein
MGGIRGVSVRKIQLNRRSKPIQTEKKSILMVRIKNRTKSIENQRGLVQCSDRILKIDEQTEPNQYILLSFF